MKPAFPIIQTGDALYTSLNNYWLFQQNGIDLIGNNDYTVDPSITYPLVDGYTLDSVGLGLTLSALTSTTTFSIAGRIRVRTQAAGVILKKTAGLGLNIVTNTDGYKLQYNVTPNTTKLVLGTWYDYLYTYDGTTQKYYINGVLDGSSAQTIASANWDIGFTGIDGQLSWMGVWINRVLDATDAVTLVIDPYSVARRVTTISSGIAHELGLSLGLI